jgi:exopolysaccharide production protein ExoZ
MGWGKCLADAAHGQKFAGVEACRGVAATMVVLYHAARHLDHVYGVPGLMRVFQFGHAGVDLFFVLSGFIIFFVHRDDIDRPDRIGHYAARRFTRILPVYWVALTVTIVMRFAGGHGLPAFSDVAWSAALLPSHNEPILGVAWTLQFEIVFYVVFGVLILNRRLGWAAFAVWLAWILLAAFDGALGGTVPKSLYAMYNLEFFLGMAVAYGFRRRVIPAPRRLWMTGIALFGIAAMAENMQWIDGYADASRLIYGLPAAMIVLGLAAQDRIRAIRVPHALMRLGAASYSTYLFQFVFISVAWKLWLATGLDAKAPHVASFPLLVAAGVSGGLVTSRWVEYPLMTVVRRVVRGARVRPPSGL